MDPRAVDNYLFFMDVLKARRSPVPVRIGEPDEPSPQNCTQMCLSWHPTRQFPNYIHLFGKDNDGEG